MNNKKNLGQFYTTNYEYILKGFNIPENIKKIIEPFVGKEDLLNFIKDKSKYEIECYDIDPQNKDTIKRDTIDDPPSYENSFILTNPPYLARNKSTNKELFDKYDTNDLYKCFIEEITGWDEIITFKIIKDANGKPIKDENGKSKRQKIIKKHKFDGNKPLGGIIIIPLNFWCSIRKKDIDLRRRFLQKYKIIGLNIFEKSVFSDTSYTVCSFQFEQKTNEDETKFTATIYPSEIKIKMCLNENNIYLVGGEIYTLQDNSEYEIERWTKKKYDEIFKNDQSLKKRITNVHVKCIDNNSQNKIGLFYDETKNYKDITDKSSNRAYATLIIYPILSIPKQKTLVEKFNTFLNEKRKKYNSLFLTNYRESNDISRKRISFKLVYSIINHLLSEMNDS